MERPFYKNRFRHGLICIGLSASLLISSCTVPSVSSGGAIEVGTSRAESDLRDRSAAMQKTIVEAIAVGALAGLGVGFLDKDINGNAFGELGLGGYLVAGAVAGALLGSYVAYLQNDFASKEDRLARARADIRANNAEAAATLQVMQRVKINQINELNRLRQAVDAGRADAAQLDREVSQARANLREMRGAIKGAERRQRDFSKARRVVAVDGDANNINAELEELSSRISQMRAVADELANEI